MFTCTVDQNIELRLHEERHVDAIWALTEADREHARVWLPWVDGATSIESSRDFVKRSLHGFAEGTMLSLGVWVDHQLVGGVGFNKIDQSNRKAEIGYWLAGWMQGQGIMTRCVVKLCDYGFYELKLNRIAIHVATGNARSRAIPKRLGFVEEGTLRQCAWANDQPQDHVIYGMLAGEWRIRQL